MKRMKSDDVCGACVCAYVCVIQVNEKECVCDVVRYWVRKGEVKRGEKGNGKGSRAEQRGAAEKKN